eukprot:gene4280-4534_t
MALAWPSTPRSLDFQAKTLDNGDLELMLLQGVALDAAALIVSCKHEPLEEVYGSGRRKNVIILHKPEKAWTLSGNSHNKNMHSSAGNKMTAIQLHPNDLQEAVQLFRQCAIYQDANYEDHLLCTDDIAAEALRDMQQRGVSHFVPAMKQTSAYKSSPEAQQIPDDGWCDLELPAEAEPTGPLNSQEWKLRVACALVASNQHYHLYKLKPPAQLLPSVFDALASGKGALGLLTVMDLPSDDSAAWSEEEEDDVLRLLDQQEEEDLRRERVLHVSKLLQITPDSATAVAAQVPLLLAIPPKQLQQRLVTASKLLNISQQQLKDVAALQPGLLVHPSEVLKIRIRCLEKLLGLSAEDAVRLAAAEPALLTFRHEDVAARLGDMAKELGLTVSRTSNLVCRRPGLLVLPPAVVKQRLSAALDLLQLPPDAGKSLVFANSYSLNDDQLVASQMWKGQVGKLGLVLWMHSMQKTTVPIEKVRLMAAERPVLLVHSSDVIRSAAHQALAHTKPEQPHR